MNDIDISLFYGKNIYIYIYIMTTIRNYNIIIHIYISDYIIILTDSMGFSFLEYLIFKM